MSEFGGLECFWSNLDKHPKCPHGPTLLFGRYNNGELKQFYTCSACRDRKSCTFYAEEDTKLTESQKKAWKEEARKSLPFYNHRRLFIRFNEAMLEKPEKRAYCHGCNKLVLFAERCEHANHDLHIGLTDEEMNNPTMILKPLVNVKKEAQYLFSNKATTEITNMLVKAGAEQVLCIGTPRIHERITQTLSHKMSSLLLDFDGRFHNFFGPLNYCWYNLFNHYFFTEEAAQTFRDFIIQNKGRNTLVICDPPFGGRVESISQTLKTISDQHKKLNCIKDSELELKIVFVFPYFMESIMQRKSNPPGVSGGLKDLKMADYKVDYDNHPLFLTGSGGRKYGSPVRIFTNISLSLLELPAEDGYKLCAKCQKWISSENKHCTKCKACTSKDGRRYKHCDLCQRCVKPTWKHCETCERCTLEKHACGDKPKVSGRCFKCDKFDHVDKDCENRTEMQNRRKRKNNATGRETVAKKQSMSLLEKTMTPKKRALVEFTKSENKNKRKNRTDPVAKNEETEIPEALTAKKKKNMRKIKKNAPEEWFGVENINKQKNKSNGNVGKNETTNIPAVTLTAKDERLKRIMKKLPAKAMEELPKRTLKVQTLKTSVGSKASKNVERSTIRKIKRT